MAKKRKELTASKVREILRLGLKYQLGDREISRSCGVSLVTVWAYLKQVKESGLSWTDVASLDETQILKFVQGAHRSKNHRSIPEPVWEYIHKELRKRGVTPQLLWEDYKERHPDGHQSTQFYERYKRWRWKRTISPWMRQNHKAGDKLFVDYAGHTVPI